MAPLSETSLPETLFEGELARPSLPARSGRAARVVEAARRVVELEGADALTMRRLAEQLGIQAPSLYKHFASKADVELALIEEAFVQVGDATHAAIHDESGGGPLQKLLVAYRREATSHANLYRMVATRPLQRDRMTPGLEEWAGNAWYVVTGDPSLAQAAWSFAHGMVVLEIDDRFPPGSDLDATWAAGAAAFEQAASVSRPRP